MSIEDIINSYNPDAVLQEASTIPASWYLHPEIAELERATVFSRSWQAAARMDQIDEAGAYATSVIAGEPVVVVRAHDGVRAFFNVCRHHAAAVASGETGRASQLCCPYHGWTYSLKGELISAPDLGGVCNFDRERMGLRPIETLTWNGWVWTKFQSGPPALDAAPQLSVEGLHWFERRRYVVDCNWKVFVDNYLDGGYHVPHAHKSLHHRLDFAGYQVELGPRSCLQWSPLRSGGRALYYWFYPNFMINRYPDAMDANIVIPAGVDRTEVIFDYYFSDVSDQARETNLQRIAASEAIQDEDAVICKSVQRGLGSRAYIAGRLSARREAGEHLFHRLLYSDLKSAPSREG
jgi:choline monooxygenase